MVFLVSRERYRSPLQLCSQAQNLIRHIRCQNIKMNRDCSVWWNFQNMDGIDFVDYSTKSRPNKRFNPQNLTNRSVLKFGFSPRETTVSMMMKTLMTTPSSPSLLHPVVSNSRRSPPLRTSCRSDLCCYKRLAVPVLQYFIFFPFIFWLWALHEVS